MDVKELKDKLSQPFDSGRWKEVVECVFPGSQYWAHERVIPSDAEIVEHFTDKGTIRLADGKNLALVELHLKKGAVNLPKNRVKLRGLVAGLIDQERAHGVIAVFEQGGKDYRLSFVAKEAVIEDGEFKTRETPAKRYTYLLGPGETCRTAAERLHALSQKQELKLDDITDAFNVEKLNKQFFKDYQAQYEKFCSFLAAPENGFRKTVFGIPAKADEKEAKPIRDFVKRLLGRLVFLQFLQKKGWMGCPADSRHWKNGDRHFLQGFFAGCADPEHFHSAFLTPLFYDALNRENRDHDLFDLTGTRIPYLNGGLFEDDLPATKAIDFPTDYFKGLLGFFGEYNFTIDENDPMDAEVGIDPEMLGHIFENLLEDNKDKGAYYTPKAIVHYMCQESLLQYLETGLNVDKSSSVAARSTPATTELEEWLRSPDKTVSDDRNNFVRKNARRIEELLDAVKICDPAIGSGAFPMGLLQEIYRCKLNLDFTLDPAEVKRGIIQNSIYGVDIEKGAVDIARLRFWLSLVVDEETPSPLPNLDYKIMQGNSLLESFEGVNLKFEVKRAQLKIVKEVDLFGKVVNPQDDFIDFLQSTGGGDTWDLEQIERAYFEEHDPQKKAEMRRQVDETEKRFINERLDEKAEEIRALLTRQKKKLAELQKVDKRKNLSNSREAKLIQTLEAELSRLKAAKEKLAAIQPGEKPYFLWQLYFMDVFKNGGFDIVIGNPPYVRQEDIKEYKEALSAAFSCYTGTADLFVYFFERGSQLLKQGGVQTFICSNKYFRAGYGKPLRQFLTDHMQIRVLIDFGDAPVFDATAYPSIIVMQKTATPSNIISFDAMTWTPGPRIEDFAAIFEQRRFSMKQEYLTADGWQLENPQVFALMQKLRAAGKPLSEYVGERFYRGVTTGYNEAFVIDRGTRDQLISEDPKSQELIKPYLRGKDVKRWAPSYADLWLIFPRRGVDISKYPAVKKHLSAFKKQLMPGIDGGRKPGSYKWYEIQDETKYWEEFEAPKIISTKMSIGPTFAFDSTGCYLGNTCYLFVSGAAHYLIGVLNSAIFFFYAKKIFVEKQNGWFEIQPDGLRAFIIPAATPAQQKEIEKLVERILALKKKNPDADVSALETEIDQFVYKLYNLTESEIAIVEGRA